MNKGMNEYMCALVPLYGYTVSLLEDAQEED